jgi:hypothetical protein
MMRLSGRLTIITRLRRSYRSFQKNILYDFQPVLLLGLWVIIIILGYIGYVWAFTSMGETMPALDTMYITMQLFFAGYHLDISPPNTALQIARFVAPVLMFSTIFVLVVSLFFENFSRFFLRISRNHIIICGLGLLGPVLVERFCEQGHVVVVIEKDMTTEGTDRCKTSGAYLLEGDATNAHELKRAGVDRANYLIAVTGDDEINAEIAGLASGIPRTVPDVPLTCYLHIVDLNLYTLLKETEFQKIHAPFFRLDVFNIYQSAGSAMLQHPDPFPGNLADPSKVRLLVIGLGRMGESLIFQAVKQWHVLGNGRKLPVTIIDTHAVQKKEAFLLRYPSLIKYCDLQPVVMDIRTPEFIRGGFLTVAPNQISFSHIFICVGDPSLGLTAGLAIHKKLQDGNMAKEGKEVPIVIRTNHQTGLSSYLETMKKSGEVFSNLHVFPLIDENCNLDVILNTTHETIARAIHSEYIKNEREAGHTKADNPRMVPWDNLPEEYKDSNRSQADHIIEKLQVITCGATPIIDWDEPLFDIMPYLEMLAEMEHERWVKEKIAAGWKWGPIRDDRWWYLRHPSIIPWKDLPESEKDKDRHSVKIIPELLKSVDLKITRL